MPSPSIMWLSQSRTTLSAPIIRPLSGHERSESKIVSSIIVSPHKTWPAETLPTLTTIKTDNATRSNRGDFRCAVFPPTYFEMPLTAIC